MKVGVIGAGFAGLSAAFELVKERHDVTVIEKDKNPGGLAIGYQEKGWEWPLEQHYHHLFTNDNSILSLAKEINYPILTKTPQTNWYIQGKIYQFVSLKAALTFPLLSFPQRIRQLCALALLRFDPFWKPLEKFKTQDVMPKLMGEKAYRMLWETILKNKFGKYANEISLAWFWARIKKRTQSLAYPSGGFLCFAKHLVMVIQKKEGIFLFDCETTTITKKGKKIEVTIKKGSTEKKILFDKVIVTLPSFAFIKLTPNLPEDYKKNLTQLKGLGATNMVLRLKKPFFPDKTYWLSVAEKSSPIMAIIEHTNFMDKSHYHNEHIVYLGNYMELTDERFVSTKEKILELYDPFLKKINPSYKTNLIDYQLFKAPFAQPIIPINYSIHIPTFDTPIKNLYLANMQQVYPWDRGTNYAIELGIKIAHHITK